MFNKRRGSYQLTIAEQQGYYNHLVYNLKCNELLAACIVAAYNRPYPLKMANMTTLSAAIMNNINWIESGEVWFWQPVYRSILEHESRGANVEETQS